VPQALIQEELIACVELPQCLSLCVSACVVCRGSTPGPASECRSLGSLQAEPRQVPVLLSVQTVMKRFCGATPGCDDRVSFCSKARSSATSAYCEFSSAATRCASLQLSIEPSSHSPSPPFLPLPSLPPFLPSICAPPNSTEPPNRFRPSPPARVPALAPTRLARAHGLLPQHPHGCLCAGALLP
jgi:hypothetical protein